MPEIEKKGYECWTIGKKSESIIDLYWEIRQLVKIRINYRFAMGNWTISKKSELIINLKLEIGKSVNNQNQLSIYNL